MELEEIYDLIDSMTLEEVLRTYPAAQDFLKNLRLSELNLQFPMGSLSGANLEKAAYVWIPMLIGLVPIFALRWRMNLLTMQDDEARSIGVNTRRDRTIVILCSTLLTAASVSVSGIIGWVGLVIPHMARKLVGNDCRQLIPAAGLFGAIFMILVDDLARNLYTTELPLGILTAVIGAPFFIYLLSRRGDW